MLLALGNSAVQFVVAVRDEGTIERFDCLKIDGVVTLQDVLHGVSVSVTEAIRDEQVSHGELSLLVTDIEEYRLLTGVHDSEMVSHMVVLRETSLSELKEAVLSTRHMDHDLSGADGLRYKHVVLRHDDAVAGSERLLLSLEEVVGVVQVHGLLPALTRLLVTLERRVVSNEDAGLIVLGLLVARKLDAVSSGAPCEVEHI